LDLPTRFKGDSVVEAISLAQPEEVERVCAILSKLHKLTGRWFGVRKRMRLSSAKRLSPINEDRRETRTKAASLAYRGIPIAGAGVNKTA
jgi:hypothetical protein